MTFSWSIPQGVGAYQNGNDVVIWGAWTPSNYTFDLTYTIDGISATNSVLFIVDDCSGIFQLRKAPEKQVDNHSSRFNGIKLYPNPTTEYIQIDLPMKDISSDYTVKIINALGQVSYSQVFGFLSNKIDTHSLVEGIYTVLIQDKTGQIKHSSKILKQKQQ